MNPVTGASSGFSRLTADALAKAGHTVYALMRDTVDLRPIELDVSSEKSIDPAIRRRTGQVRRSRAQ